MRIPNQFAFPDKFTIRECINVLEFVNVSSLKGLFISNKWQLILVCSKIHILIFDLPSRGLKLICTPDCGNSSIVDDFTNVVIEEMSQRGSDGDSLILSHSGIHNGFIIKLDLRSVLENRQHEIVWKKNLTHIPSGMVLRYNVIYEDSAYNLIYSVDFSEVLILNSKDSNVIAKIQKGAELSPFSLCFSEEDHFIFVCEFVSVAMMKEDGLKNWTKINEFTNSSMLLPSEIVVDPLTKQFLVLSDGNVHIFNWETKKLIQKCEFPIKNPLGAFWFGKRGELFISDAFSRQIFILK